jgi:hypothetical protein
MLTERIEKNYTIRLGLKPPQDLQVVGGSLIRRLSGTRENLI